MTFGLQIHSSVVAIRTHLVSRLDALLVLLGLIELDHLLE